MPAPAIRILVVEDSDDDFEILSLQLAKSGLAADMARVEDETGMKASLAARPPELVISDYQMPRFSFERALATLRASDSDIPLIVVSGAIGEEAAVDAMLAGAEDYIRKDNLLRLVPAIRRSIEAAQTRRRQRRAEAALRESESMLRSLLDNLPAVTLRLEYDLKDRKLGLSYVGGAANQLFNTRPQDLMNRPESLVKALAPQERPGFLEFVHLAAAERRDFSWEGRTASGQGGRWLQVQGRLRKSDARAAMWNVVAVDVSEAKRAEAEIRELTAHLEDVKERERTSIAREIHDDIGASFFGLKIDLAWLRKRAAADAAMNERLDTIDKYLSEGIEASQRIVRSLRPAVLDFGICGAVEWLSKDFAKRTGIACELDNPGEELELPDQVATAVFRVLQESLTNISRHAGASSVKVSLAAAEGKVVLEVVDDGKGFGARDLAKRGSFGVRGMRERARELGGALEIAGGEGKGTRMSLRVPLPQEAKAASL